MKFFITSSLSRSRGLMTSSNLSASLANACRGVLPAYEQLQQLSSTNSELRRAGRSAQVTRIMYALTSLLHREPLLPIDEME